MAINPQDNKQKKLFEQYIASRKIIIADTNTSSRTGLAKTLSDLGAKTQNMFLCMTYESAVEEIKKHQPHVVLCDYELGGQCGLNLLQEQRKEQPDFNKSLFILVTANTSQSAVAQAAEEDVDTYILKPYTIDTLRSSIMKAALFKINPSDYFKKIQEGKDLLFSGKIDESKAVFKEAQGLNDKPSLACFYHGQAEFMGKVMDAAKSDYDDGLDHNKIHYKCLVGLYELFMEQKMYSEAYEIVQRISRYFPANPERLTSVLRLAVMTKKYEDIERYYQNFVNLDARNEELVKYVCAALVVTGKFYLQQKFGSRAVELFKKAGVTAAGKPSILREIITSLCQFKLYKEAQEFLPKFPPETRKQADFLAMEYLIADQMAPANAVIERGRKIIEEGIEDPLIYQILIKKSAHAGFGDSAEKYSADACKKWPEKAKLFDVPEVEAADEEEDEGEEEAEAEAKSA